MKKILGKVIYKITIITLVLGFLIQTISLFPFYVFANTEETLNEIEINSVNNVDESDVRLLYEVEDMKDELLKDNLIFLFSCIFLGSFTLYLLISCEYSLFSSLYDASTSKNFSPSK